MWARLIKEKGHHCAINCVTVCTASLSWEAWSWRQGELSARAFSKQIFVCARRVQESGGGAQTALEKRGGTESKMASKLKEMVRNSPLVKRKGSGGYEVLDSEKKDPFVKGISFNAQYCASTEVQDKHNSPAIQETVLELCRNVKKSALRKVVLTVKAQSLCVTDVSTKIADSYPIFLVAYCGGHQDVESCFFFIHKTKLEKTMRVEVFKCSSEDKVKAITITLAKAFNISYKAWVMKTKKAEKSENGAGSESPALRRKALQLQQKSNLAKIAPGIVTGGTHTPPAPRKPPSDSTEDTSGERLRSGSFGDQPAPSALANPAVVRVLARNAVTGSTHNVTLTDEFDKEFQALAESRTKPEVLRTSFVEEDTDYFSFDTIKAHIDEDPN